MRCIYCEGRITPGPFSEDNDACTCGFGQPTSAPLPPAPSFQKEFEEARRLLRQLRDAPRCYGGGASHYRSGKWRFDGCPHCAIEEQVDIFLAKTRGTKRATPE